MKLVREHINEKFTDDSDPIKDMGIGIRHKIEEWLKEYDKKVINYRINADLTIDADLLDFFGSGIGNLPKYINFNKISYKLDFHEANLTSLRGFPKKFNGAIYLGLNKLESLKYIPVGKIGDLMLFSNDLKSLKGCPQEIIGNFNCSKNPNLKSLEYMPSKINGNFICFNTGMTDKYIANYIKTNKIYIFGKKIITSLDAEREHYF